jgi:hypothetical protein
MRGIPARSQMLSLTISKKASLITQSDGVLIFTAAGTTDAKDAEANRAVS